VKKITAENAYKIVELINNTKKICLLGHHNPDGDAIAGCLAVQRVLKNTGTDSTVIMPSEMPDFLKFLPGTEEIITHKANEKDSPAVKTLLEADLILCIDFNAPSRVKALEKTLRESKAVKILMDHHPEPEDFAEYTLSKTESSSASEIVFEFMEWAGLRQFFDKETAMILYTGIMTDTLNFSINTAGKKTFRRIAELLDFGINKEKIYDAVYNTFSWERMQLTGHLINNKTKLIEEHQVAYTIFEKSDKEKFNYKLGDHEGIVNIPLSVQNVKASLIFMENDNKIKVSLRSKAGFDVNALARKYFDGGGHRQAAGGTLHIKVEEIPEFLKNALDNFEK
jgi:phosphoesterase RecJ-like protein